MTLEDPGWSGHCPAPVGGPETTVQDGRQRAHLQLVHAMRAWPEPPPSVTSLAVTVTDPPRIP
jgi:hypothetical protein